ncbi:MAG: hypothetical protein NTX73_07620 [Rhodobacterales bacterium]|nr:hypothetical protein [Rhodobacterales bacterium]
MATIIILLGSVVGFLTAGISFVFLDYSLLAAVAIWGASGPVSAVLAAILIWRPDDTPRETSREPARTSVAEIP